MVDCINGSNNNSQRHQPWSFVELRDVTLIFAFLTVTALLSLAVYNSESSVQQLRHAAFQFTCVCVYTDPNTSMAKDVGALQRVLLEASTEEKTVILTTLNQAWAEPNSTFDLFLEGCHVGVGTKRLFRHLVVVCMDEEAHSRCLEIHPRCYLLKTEGVDFSGQMNFMTPYYLKMMWRRLEFYFGARI
ncbi:hypothetical protein BRARA_D02126 [Brassica rapa]|uniref:Nucleotide-diphospho-sugar transferase domain-containing protein n=1 Tax=Brassica campestris TaxID=3711 RepID=A0A397ZUD3_BRACM|nr:hypothetical protein BRARA_D02126 [Brassica rapa]